MTVFHRFQLFEHALATRSALGNAFVHASFEGDFVVEVGLEQGRERAVVLERKAFEVSRDYRAPANLMKEFLHGTVATAVRSVKPSYPHGITFCDLSRCLPDYVVRSLRGAIPLIDRRLKGFKDADAVLTGVETRSSSPVRILRNELRESNIAGIYPVGEGAGYAGGITSAAIDGLRTAMAIMTIEKDSPSL